MSNGIACGNALTQAYFGVYASHLVGFASLHGVDTLSRSERSLSGKFYVVEMLAEAAAHFCHIAFEHHARVVYERDALAHFLHRCHVVGGEKNGSTFVLQTQYFTL